MDLMLNLRCCSINRWRAPSRAYLTKRSFNSLPFHFVDLGLRLLVDRRLRYQRSNRPGAVEGPQKRRDLKVTSIRWSRPSSVQRRHRSSRPATFHLCLPSHLNIVVARAHPLAVSLPKTSTLLFVTETRSRQTLRSLSRIASFGPTSSFSSSASVSAPRRLKRREH